MKIEFNPKKKENLSYGEAVGPAMEITDQLEANKYKADYIEWQQSKGISRERAEEIVNTNLGYYAGYYSNETRARVEKLFLCSHPIFGSIVENGIPTAKEAFEAGVKLGELIKITP